MKQRQRFGRFIVVMLVLGFGALAGCSAGGANGAGGALPGVWRTRFVSSTFGGANVELILQENGSFQQQTTYDAGSLSTVLGTWRIVGEILRLDVQRGEPRQYCGPLGCTDILYPSESHYFTLRGNALQTNLATCATNPECQLNYTRAN